MTDQVVEGFEYGCRHHGTAYLMIAGVAHYVSAVRANGMTDDGLDFVETDFDYLESLPGYCYCVAPIGGEGTGMREDSCGVRIANFREEQGWVPTLEAGRVG